MQEKVLITDTLYIFDKHEKQLEEAGYRVERLPQPRATEDELCEAISDAVGYVLGGIETVTTRVVEAASRLRGIAFCGSGWTECIAAHEALTARGIPITSTAGSNARSVAEFTVTTMLAAIRQLPALWSKSLGLPTEPVQFLSPSPHEFSALRVTVVGYGHIGQQTALLLRALGFIVRVVVRSPSQVPSNLTTASLDDALADTDIVILCVNKIHGTAVMQQRHIAQLKPQALILNPVFPDAIDEAALQYGLSLANGPVFIYDAPPLPISDAVSSRLLYSNAQAAYNTNEALERTSDWATQSIINLLRTGTDERIVNIV